MDPDVDDALEPTRDHGPRNAAIAFALLGLAGLTAWGVNQRFDGERRTRERGSRAPVGHGPRKPGESKRLVA